MHPVVKQLVALQQVDVRVANVQKKLDAIPRETAKRQARVDKLRAERDAVAAELAAAETSYQDLETKVNGIDSAIKRQEAHRDQSQNASSFTAAQHQIEYLAQDKEGVQTEQIGLMERIEDRGPQLAELEQQLAAAEKEFGEYQVEANKLVEELSERRTKIAAERERFLAEVPPASLGLYNDMFQTTHGQAVVPAEGSCCTGCYTHLTPNDLVLLRTAATLVTCKACGRVLYLTDR